MTLKGFSIIGHLHIRGNNVFQDDVKPRGASKFVNNEEIKEYEMGRS